MDIDESMKLNKRLEQINAQLKELNEEKKEILKSLAPYRDYRKIANRNYDIVQMRKQGATIKEIAQKHEICEDTVSALLKYEGLENYDLYGLSAYTRNTILRCCGGKILNKESLIEKIQSNEGLLLTRGGMGIARISEIEHFVGFKIKTESGDFFHHGDGIILKKAKVEHSGDNF